MAKLGVLVIHGMGSQKAGYSKGMRDKVVRRLRAEAKAVAWEELFWANALRDRENNLWNAMLSAREPDGDRIPLDWQTVREFVVHNFGDALAYHRDGRQVSAYHEIHEIVSAGVLALKQRLDAPTSPVVVLAHSLGAHVMSNYIWDRQHRCADVAGCRARALTRRARYVELHLGPPALESYLGLGRPLRATRFVARDGQLRLQHPAAQPLVSNRDADLSPGTQCGRQTA